MVKDFFFIKILEASYCYCWEYSSSLDDENKIKGKINCIYFIVALILYYNFKFYYNILIKLGSDVKCFTKLCENL